MLTLAKLRMNMPKVWG